MTDPPWETTSFYMIQKVRNQQSSLDSLGPRTHNHGCNPESQKMDGEAVTVSTAAPLHRVTTGIVKSKMHPPVTRLAGRIIKAARK